MEFLEIAKLIYFLYFIDLFLVLLYYISVTITELVKQEQNWIRDFFARQMNIFVDELFCLYIHIYIYMYNGKERFVSVVIVMLPMNVFSGLVRIPFDF